LRTVIYCYQYWRKHVERWLSFIYIVARVLHGFVTAHFGLQGSQASGNGRAREGKAT
jgi:hypothetical protein